MPGLRRPDGGPEAAPAPRAGPGDAEPTVDPPPLVVNLYVAEGGATLARLAAGAAVLDADEAARAARFRDADTRVTYQAAHVLLRRALSAESAARGAAVPAAAWRFRQAPGGRPELAELASGSAPEPARGPAPETAPALDRADGRLRFNLSHTRGLVCCALAWDAAVGVDAEHHRPLGDLLALARRFFTAAEAAALAAQGDPLPLFYALWTLKEAHLKARGCGLVGGLDRIGFRLAAGAPGAAATIETSPPSGERAALLRRTGADWSIAVAVATPRAVDIRPRVVGSGAPLRPVALTPHVAAGSAASIFSEVSG